MILLCIESDTDIPLMIFIINTVWVCVYYEYNRHWNCKYGTASHDTLMSHTTFSECY